MHCETGPQLRYLTSCIDYRTYIAPLDTHIGQDAHIALTKRLLTLGVAEDERMGVIYVRGPWGFLVIPQPGFPELRISFYHDTSKDEVEAVLVSIRQALHACHYSAERRRE